MKKSVKNWGVGLLLLAGFVLVGALDPDRPKSFFPPEPSADKPPQATAKPYQVFHRDDFSFPGRTRVEWWVTSPEAKTFEERARTAMQAAMDLQKEAKAHVASIWLEAGPETAAKNQQLAIAMYAPDGGGLSGDQGWKWQVEAAGADLSRKKYPVK